MTTIRIAGATGKNAPLTPTEADANMKRSAATKSADYTLTAAHNREFHELAGTTATVTLPTVSGSFTETDDWFVDLKNTLSTPVTLDRASQNINDAAANYILPPGAHIRVRMNYAMDGFYTDNVPFTAKGVTAYNSGNQVAAYASWTQLLFPTESFDSEGSHVTGTGVVTIPSWATKVRWTTQVDFSEDATGRRYVKITQLSGAASYPEPYWAKNALSLGNTVVGGTTGWISVSPGATYGVEVYQDRTPGTGLNIVGTSFRTYLSAEFSA